MLLMHEFRASAEVAVDRTAGSSRIPLGIRGGVCYGSCAPVGHCDSEASFIGETLTQDSVVFPDCEFRSWCNNSGQVMQCMITRNGRVELKSGNMPGGCPEGLPEWQ